MALRAGEARPTTANETLAAMRHIVSAELAFAQGSLDAGIREVRSVLALPWDTFGDDGVAAYARWRLLEASQAQGNTQGIAEALAATDALGELRSNEPTVRLYTALVQAEVADAQGDAARARSEFERALAQAESTRIPFDLVRVVARYTRFLLQRGDVAQASAVADHIAKWAELDYSASLVRLDVDHAIGGEAWATALARTRRLAGERDIPTTLTTPPSRAAHALKGTELAAVREP
jgi:ATP/maltotriose-dependent transcriptional regulator MalT